MPFLNDPKARDRFLDIFERTRQRYRFVVVGYVVMPEHFHILISEPEVGSPLPKKKRRNARQWNLFESDAVYRAFWQARFYDFNVWTTKKRVEKLRYVHRNPVKRGLVESPEQWPWSSYRYYLLGEAGPVRVNVGWTKISLRHKVA